MAYQIGGSKRFLSSHKPIESVSLYPNPNPNPNMS